MTKVSSFERSLTGSVVGEGTVGEAKIERVGSVDEPTISIQCHVLLKRAVLRKDVCALNEEGSTISLGDIVDEPTHPLGEDGLRAPDPTC